MQQDDNTRKLYDALTADNYDLGDYDKFASDISKPGNLRKLYDTMVADNYALEDYDKFSSRFNTHQSKPQAAQPEKKFVMDEAVVASMPQGHSSQGATVPAQQTQTQKAGSPQVKPVVDGYGMPIGPQVSTKEDMPQTKWLPEQADRARQMMKEESGEDIMNYIPALFRKMKEDEWGEKRTDGELLAEWLNMDEKQQQDIVSKGRERYAEAMKYYTSTYPQEEQRQRLNAEYKAGTLGGSSAAGRAQAYKTMTSHNEAAAPWIEADKKKWSTQDAKAFREETISETMHDPYTAVPESYREYATKAWGKKGSEDAYFTAWMNLSNKERKDWLHRDQVKALFDGEGVQRIQSIRTRADEKAPGFWRRTAEARKEHPLMGSEFAMSEGMYRDATDINQQTVRAIDKAEEMKQAYKNHQGDENFFVGAFKGLKDGITDVDTWTGAYMLGEMTLLSSIVDKMNKGEKLTQDEEDYFEAQAYKMAVEAALADDLGWGYGSGKTTAVSIPMMLQMIATGGGGLATKGVDKVAAKIGERAVKGYGKTILKRMLMKGVGKGGTRALTLASRVPLAFADGAVQTTIWQSDKVVADAVRRSTGTKELAKKAGEMFGIEIEGKEAEDFGKALGKSFALYAAENGTEFLGNAFLDPLGDWMNKGIKKVVKGTKVYDDFAQVITSARRTGAGAALYDVATMGDSPFIKELMGKSQWSGLLGEGVEEKINEGINILMGEAEAEDFFDLEKNAQMLLGLSWTSLAFGVANGYSRTRAYAKIKKELDSAEKIGTLAFTAKEGEQLQETWEDFKGRIDQMSYPQLKHALSELSAEWRAAESGTISRDRAEAQLRYIMGRGQLLGFAAADSQAEMQNPFTEEQQEIDEATGEGINADEQTQKTITEERNIAEQALYDQIGEDVDEFVARYGETSDQQLQGIRTDESLSDEVRDIAENYVVTNAKFNGVVEAAEAEIEQAEQAAQREVETNANMDKEQVVRVTVNRVGEDGMTMEPTGAYVVQGDALGEDGVYDGSTVLQIRYADGMTEQVSASNVKVESVHPLQEMIDAAREGARMETINAVSTRMQNSVPTGADAVMQPGQRVTLEDGRAGVVESFDGVQMYQVKMDDGSNVVAPASVLRDEAAAQSAAQITAQAQENVKHSIAGRRGKRMSRQARMQQQSQSPTLADVRAQRQDVTAEQTSAQTATEQIPVSETGARAYDQAEPSLAWQSLVEQSGGDAQIAESALMSTIRQKEDALRQLENEAVAAGNSIEETIAAQTQHKARIEAAKADLAKWQAIAKVNQDAKAEAEQAKKAKALQESNKKAAAESNAQIDVNKVAEETGADAKEVKRLVDLCSALGVKVQFEGYTTTDGTTQGHLTNASVDTGARTITISKLQMAKGTGIHFILGHELTHQIKADGNKELWGKYLESVVNAVGIEVFQAKLASMSMTYMQAGAYQNMTMEEFREAMQEEVCADFAGEAVFSPGNVKKFLGIDPTLVEKITGKIQEMFDTIRKKIYGFSMPQDIAFAAEQWQQLAEGKELTGEEEAERRHSLVGTTGARALDKAEGTTVRMDNMDVAEEMEAAGKDAETIWLATGWERGADGKWKYEVLEDFAYEEPRAKAERLQEEYQQVQNEKENIYRYLNRFPARGLTEQQKAIKKEQNARLKKLIRQGEQLQDEIIESNFDTTLGELIGTDNNIIKAYPELASMPVSFVADSRFMDAGLKGAFDGEGIWINPTLENTAPTLLHEVQHAIQRIEGFARGGNTGSVKTKADALREDVRPLHEMMLDTPEWAEMKRLQNRWFDETDEAEIAKIEQRVNEINESGVLDAIQSKRKQLQEKYGSDATVGKILGSPYAEDAEIWQQLPESFNDKYEAYRNLAGEAEARNVSARLNMSEEERRQTRPGKTEDVAREEQTVIYAEVSDKAGAQLEETANATRYSIVVDPQLIAELEASPKRKGYRNVVQREDGLFEAPMGNSLRGNGINVENTPFAMGQWEQSEEHPELVYGDNKITLVKPDGKTVADVNYNPYIHNRLNTLNAQFKQAWERPDLVYVETEVPETDLESGYMAEHAHLSTGVHQWSNGALMLSRYDKPVRIVPWDEVAIPWIEKYKKSGVHFDIVPPALRPILAAAGVEIKAPHNGMGENCTKAYEEWKAEQEANKKGSAESRTSKATQGERSDADSHNSSSKGLPLESSERLSVSALASPKDFAKIRKNTEILKRATKKIINEGGLKRKMNTPSQAVSALGDGLHLEKSGASQSYYGDYFEGDYLVDEKVVHLRISTHPASGDRMGNAKADHKVSIVVRKNGEHHTKGEHNGYEEIVYDPAEISPDEAANAIVYGVKSLIETGKYVDTTGKAKKQTYPYVDEAGVTRYSITSVNSLTEVTNEGVMHSISPIEGYTYSEVIDMVQNDVENILSEEGADNVEAVEFWAHGSRMRGNAKEDSDLDVVMFYKGNEKEDSLFNLINEHELAIDGIKVDVNPIRISNEQDIARYKEKSAIYDQEMRFSLSAEEQDAENADIRYSMPGHSVASRIYSHPFTGTWQKFLQRAPKGVLKPGYGIIDESRLPEFADWYKMLVPEAEEYKEFVSWFLEGATATEKKHVQSVMDGVDKIVDDYRRLAEGDNSVLSLENNARFSITPDILVANERFNAELNEFKAKTHKGLLHLGKPGAILRTIGVDADEMTISPTILHQHLKEHGLTADDIKGLALSVQSPILAYRHGLKYPNLVIVTEMDVKGGKLSVSLELDGDGHVVAISNIKSVHSKDAIKEIERLMEMGAESLNNNLKWVEKEEVSDWLLRLPYEDERTKDNPKLSSVANVLLSFQNPPILEDESSQNDANAKSGEQNKRSFSITAEQIQEMTGGKLNSSNYGKVSNAINPIGRFLYSRRESEYAPYRTVIPVPTLDDYYIATETTFTAMEGGAKEWEKMKESGKYELQQSPKSGSEYLIDRETGDIFRFSDHWGTVASCRWELEGGKNEGTYEIGKSNIQDFDAHLPSYSGGYVAKNPKFEQFVDEYRNILDVTTQNYRTLLDSGIEIGKAEKKKIDAAIAQQDWLRKSLEKSNWMPRYNEIKYSLPARPATPKRNEGEGIMAYAERVARVLKAQRAWDVANKTAMDIDRQIKNSEEYRDILAQKEPQTIEEAASLALAGGKLLWNDHVDGTKVSKGAKSMMGWGEDERRSFFAMFASKENGGVSVEQMGEAVMEICSQYNIPVDETDAMAGTNAVLEVLQSAKSPSDITGYIEHNRIEQVRRMIEEEQELLASERNRAYMDMYGMTYDDFVEIASTIDTEDEQERSDDKNVIAWLYGQSQRQQDRITNAQAELEQLKRNGVPKTQYDAAYRALEQMKAKVKRTQEMLDEATKELRTAKGQATRHRKANMRYKAKKGQWKQVFQKLREAINGKNIRSIDKNTLNEIMRAVGNADLSGMARLFGEAGMVEDIILGVNMRATQDRIDKLLATKTTALNDKGIATGKSVDASVQAILANVRKTLEGILHHDIENQIHDLRSQNWHIRHNAVGNLGQEQQEQVDANKAKIEELKAELGKELATSTATTEQAVNEQIEKLTEQIDMGLRTEEESAELMTTLALKRQMVAIHTSYQDTATVEALLIRKQSELRTNWVALHDGNTPQDKREEYRQKRKALQEQIAGLEAQVREGRQATLDAMQSFADSLEETITTGRANLKGKMQEQLQRRKEFVAKAIHDVNASGKQMQSVNEADKQENDKLPWYKRMFSPALRTFDYMLQKVATRTYGKDSWLYRQFMLGENGVMAAHDEYLRGMQTAARTLEDKAMEIFGKPYQDVMAESNRKKDIGIEILRDAEDYEPSYIPLKLTKGQATYIYMLWRMRDGFSKLATQGFTEEIMQRIEEYIGPDYIQWADWMQMEYLPMMREKYNARYREIYDTNMAAIDNYVPIRIHGQAIRKEVDLTDATASMPGMQKKNGALIQRTVNVNPIDISNNIFELIGQHIDEMEEFYAYAPVRRDLQYILSSPAFRNLLNTQEPGTFQSLLEAARIATKTNQQPESAALKAFNDFMNKTQKGLVSGNIAYRNLTAIKQVLSAPAFIGYSQSPVYLGILAKNMLGGYLRNMPTMAFSLIPGIGHWAQKMTVEETAKGMPYIDKFLGETFRWCMREFPDFRERVTRGSAGDIRLEEKGFSELLDKYTEIGMSANVFIDAVTVSIGLKSIYDYEMKKAEKRIQKMAEEMQMDEQWAEEEMRKASNAAKIQATLFANQTQQSSNPALLSPMQVSKNFMERSLTLYKNSSLGLMRAGIGGMRNLLRYMKGKKARRRMTEEYTRMFMQEGFAENEAKKRAISYINSEARKGAFVALLEGFAMNVIWNLGSKGLLGFMTGGGDDDDKERTIGEMVWDGTKFVINNTFGSAIPFVNDALEGRLPAIGLTTSEAEKAWKDTEKQLDENGISLAFALTGMRYAAKFSGIDVETWANSMDGYYRLVADTGNNDERLLALMLVLNSPRSNRMAVARELYKGASEEEFQKAIELAGRYNRPAWAYGREMTDKVKSDMINWYIEDNMTPEEAERAKEVRKWKARIEAAKTIDEASALYNEAPDMAIKEMVQQRMNEIANPTQEKTFEEKVESKEKDIYAMEDEQYKYYQKVCKGTDVAEDIALREKIKQYAPAWNEYVASPERSKVMERRGSEILKYRMLSKYRSNINKAKAILDRNKDKSQLGRIRKMRKEALAM